MDPDETKNRLCSDIDAKDDTSSAVNSLVLDYYKKFGRKRDLEQYFSLTTAQSELRDPSGLFWRRMKTQYDSDSGEKKSESSTELCRISIKCTVPDQSSTSQGEKGSLNPVTNESESPPIIVEEKSSPIPVKSDNDSEDNTSQKSAENFLDSSANKPFSPTSSINSQRKLEWDSLADVGYSNEGDRKTSASSLSTLERLALQQQYSNNDNNQPETNIGLPTSQSTPIEESQPNKSKTNKKSLIKTTKYYKKDIDYVQVNVPQETDNTRAINVNLTKHISFNVNDNNCVVTPQSTKQEFVTSSPPKMVSVETEIIPKLFDKQIQTSLNRVQDSKVGVKMPITSLPRKKSRKRVRAPIMLNLNTLHRRLKNRKSKTSSRRICRKTSTDASEKQSHQQDKSGEPISEAESFEYMPGHIYNRNLSLLETQNKNKNAAGNKSSLESSSGITTESSKETISFTKDLEKSIDQLKKIVDQRQKNTDFKKQVVKEIVRTLVRSKYKDDDSGTEFLSGLSFNSRILDLGQGDNTTTSTSDQNTIDKSKDKPRKSILRKDNVFPETQSVTNLSSKCNTEKKSNKKLVKSNYFNTDSDESSKSKHSSEELKTSSEELYLQYLEALRKEEAYKTHLKSKELFLKQKLTGSATSLKNQIPLLQLTLKPNKLNKLVKDLSANNYDNGSGDAYKVSNDSNVLLRDDNKSSGIKTYRSHSVYTLSSAASANTSKKFEIAADQEEMKEKLRKEFEKTQHKQHDREVASPSCSGRHFSPRTDVTDSSVQVNIESKSENRNPCNVYANEQLKYDSKSKELSTHLMSEKLTGELKYVCLCTQSHSGTKDSSMPDNLMIFKCSCLAKEKTLSEKLSRCSQMMDGVQYQDSEFPTSKHLGNKHCYERNENVYTLSERIYREMKTSRSSQTNSLIPTIIKNGSRKNSVCSDTSSSRRNDIKENATIVREIPHTLENVSKSIMMCSCSIQTKISIYPKISDPTLADINIINQTSNDKLFEKQHCRNDNDAINFGQQFKSINSIDRNRASSSVVDSQHAEVCSSKSKLSIASELADNDWCTLLDRKQPSENVTKRKQFTVPDDTQVSKLKVTVCEEELNMIPIEEKETRVELTASSGHVPSNISSLDTVVKTDKISQGVTTETINYNDQETSMDNECFNTIQYCNDEIFCQTSVDNFVEQKYVSKAEPHSKDSKENDENNKNNIVPTNYNCKDAELEYDRNKGDKTEISPTSSMSTSKPTKKNMFNVINVSNSPLLENDETYSKYHTYPSTKKIQSKDKCFLTANTDADILKFDNKQSKDNKISRRLACLKYLNRVETDDSPKFTTVQMMKTADLPIDIPPRKASCVQSDGDVHNAERNAFNREDDHSEQTNEENVNKIKSNDHVSNYSDGSGTSSKDPIMTLIKDITKRYAKHDLEKSNKKKCFKEIMFVLNYLLDTDESTDTDPVKTSSNVTTSEQAFKLKDKIEKKFKDVLTSPREKKLVDKATQLYYEMQSHMKTKQAFYYEESSDMPMSSDVPDGSVESPACQILNKIKKECEKYQKRCKSSRSRKIETSSSTSVYCEKCESKQDHKCTHGHKCKNHKHAKASKSKIKKECIAYNLIIQPSDSMVNDETIYDRNHKPLPNIIIKVPSKRKHVIKSKPVDATTTYKLQKSPRKENAHRYGHTRKTTKDMETNTDEQPCHDTMAMTVRDYLETNRPDFVERTLKRQDCLKGLKATRSRDRTVRRELLAELDVEKANVAAEIQAFDGLPFGRPGRIAAPKFVSEREMKKHSERIYKTLPEVTRKKEELKKERIKKTNLIMAHLFNKNLQRRTLKGSVNVSNYSAVIKI